MIAPFLQNLFDHGHVHVGHPDQSVGEGELRVAEEVLADYEVIRRQGFPGAAPPFSTQAAVWAAKSFYRACQAATFRDIPAELLPQFLCEQCPKTESSSLHYSVDLVFQYLPDLTKLAGYVMSADPLLDHLRMWANQWPLSSVGMQEVTPVSLQGIVEHSSLLQYYVDRIIARRDKTRITDPLVQQVLRTRVSVYKELFPQFG